LIAATGVAVHLAVIGDCGNALALEEVYSFFHTFDGRGVDDQVVVAIVIQSAQEQGWLGAGVTFLDDVA